MGICVIEDNKRFNEIRVTVSEIIGVGQQRHRVIVSACNELVALSAFSCCRSKVTLRVVAETGVSIKRPSSGGRLISSELKPIETLLWWISYVWLSQDLWRIWLLALYWPIKIIRNVTNRFIILELWSRKIWIRTWAWNWIIEKIN